MLTLTNEVKSTLSRQAIEVPSWAFGNLGTRFKVFSQAGVPRDPFEKVADAAQVHRFTGLAPTVALHIPWDRVDDFDKFARFAEELGIQLGTINTNTFQDDDYKLGSLCHVDEAIRTKAVGHALECIYIMDIVGSNDLKIWLPDGFQLPGTGRSPGPTGSARRLARSDLRPTQRGPASRSRVQVLRTRVLFHRRPGLGDGVRSVPCTGGACGRVPRHGPPRPGTNIEFIVMQLLRLGKLGAFDFNSRFYADDDLMVGAADPFQLFRILCEVVRGGGFDAGSRVHFMLDQCHNIEAKIPAQIRSVLNVQEMTARALLVDREALARAERAGDVIGANDALMDAFYTDVRPALAEWRTENGLPEDPMAAYRASGYAEQIIADRVGGEQVGWGA